MFVAGLLEGLAEVLLLVVSAVLDYLTGEDVVDIEVCVDVDQVCEGGCALELELGDQLPVGCECAGVDEGFEDVVEQGHGSGFVGLGEEGLRAPDRKVPHQLQVAAGLAQR